MRLSYQSNYSLLDIFRCCLTGSLHFVCHVFFVMFQDLIFATTRAWTNRHSYQFSDITWSPKNPGLLHFSRRELTSDWSRNSFIMIAYGKKYSCFLEKVLLELKMKTKILRAVHTVQLRLHFFLQWMDCMGFLTCYDCSNTINCTAYLSFSSMTFPEFTEFNESWQSTKF